MRAAILSIGDELVLGQTVDTNSTWLSAQLAASGCDVVAHMTVGDDRDATTRGIARLAEVVDLVLVSGGLGPTADDLTRPALADFVQTPLELNPAAAEALKAFFTRINRHMPQSNLEQAMIPHGVSMIENTAGTAPGMHARVSRQRLGSTDGQSRIATRADEPVVHVYCMPGVPKEMKIMFQRSIQPAVMEMSHGAAIISRTLHTFGLGESNLAERLGDLMRRDRNPSVGTTVSAGVVSLRINARFESAQHAKIELEKTDADCRRALGSLIYGADGLLLQESVGRLLLDRIAAGSPLTVTTAESCTGGILAGMLTDIPGSSGYFRQGYVTYANQAKQDLLGVPAELLVSHGAVSEPAVLAMATAARQRSGSDVALAVSGIAGPDGGTVDKPVGTVWVALASAGQTYARKWIFTGDREMVRDRAAKMALTLLRFHLLNEPLPF